MQKAMTALLALALGACSATSGIGSGIGPGIGSAGTASRSASDPRIAAPARPNTVPQPAQPNANAGFKGPNVMREAGLEAIIGARAADITARYGKARIDLTEGDARKLQFVSDACVLDIYLYPLAAGRTPVATHVEARERNGGAQTGRAACAQQVARTQRR